MTQFELDLYKFFPQHEGWEWVWNGEFLEKRNGVNTMSCIQDCEDKLKEFFKLLIVQKQFGIYDYEEDIHHWGYLENSPLVFKTLGFAVELYKGKLLFNVE